MWHVSAPHRPCIGHRTGYSLLENARTSGLASADFEGVFAHSYKRWRPRLFLRALRKLSPQNCSSVAASAACAPLNPAYGADELERYFADLQPRALIAQAGCDCPSRRVALSRGVRVIELSFAWSA